MGLFTKPTENAKFIMDYLGCECRHFPAGKPAQLIQSSYEEAFARMEMDKTTPLLITVDDMLVEDIKSKIKPGETAEQCRTKILSETSGDASEWFMDNLRKMKEEFGEYWNEITADTDISGIRTTRLCSFVDTLTQKTKEVILAKIPTDKPWEVFAWFPFGGWNACPLPEEHIMISRYWYQKFGAVPAALSHDILEFVAQPLRDKSAAVGLALEQYAFCPDIIDQGMQMVGILANSLTKSSVWSFWWD